MKTWDSFGGPYQSEEQPERNNLGPIENLPSPLKGEPPLVSTPDLSEANTTPHSPLADIAPEVVRHGNKPRMAASPHSVGHNQGY